MKLHFGSYINIPDTMSRGAGGCTLALCLLSHCSPVLMSGFTVSDVYTDVCTDLPTPVIT